MEPGRRVMRGVRRVPRLVWCITGLYFVVLLGYSVLLPAYRAPDEPRQVDIVHLFAEEQTYPAWDGRRVGSEIVRSTDEVRFGSGRLTAGQAPPRSERRPFDEMVGTAEVGGFNQIAQHPPLYYVLAGGAERAVEVVTGEPRFDLELWFYRLVSVLLVTPLPLIVWWITQQLGLRRDLGVAATLVPLAVPQLLHIGSAVNNDSLLLLTFWLSTGMVVRFARGDLRARTALLAGAIVGAGLLTKGFALVLPAYGLAGIALAMLRGGWSRGWPGLRAAAVFAGTAFALGGWWWVRNLVRYGELNPSVYYQEVPIRDHVDVDFWGFVGTWAGRTTLRFWGSFGWYEVKLPTTLVVVATAVVLVGLLMACIRRDRAAGVPLGDRFLLASPLVLLVVFQFAFALRNYALTGGYPGMQGRYWFGALAGVAVAVTLGLANLVRGHTRALPLVVLGGAAAMNVVAVSRLLGFYWGRSDARLSDRIDALVAWSPLPQGVLVVGLVVGGLLLLVTAGQLGWLALRGPEQAAGHGRSPVTGPPLPPVRTIAVWGGLLRPGASGNGGNGGPPSRPDAQQLDEQGGEGNGRHAEHQPVGDGSAGSVG
jgi:small subunit ribosomal protein S36